MNVTTKVDRRRIAMKQEINSNHNIKSNTGLWGILTITTPHACVVHVYTPSELKSVIHQY